MDLSELKSYVNYILNKDQMGEPLSADNYNILLDVSNEGYYYLNYKEVLSIAAAPGITFTAKLLNNNPLSKFLKTKTYTGVLASPIDLPEDIKRTIGATALYSSTAGIGGIPPPPPEINPNQPSWRLVDYVDSEEYDKIRYNVLSKSLKRHPVMKETSDGYYIVPSNPKKLVVNYLRKVKKPYYDYCIGVNNDVEYYMPVGSYINEAGGVKNLYDSDNNLLAENVVHLSATLYPYGSKTIELDWNEEDISKIGDIIIGMASIKNRELEVSQLTSKKVNE